MSDDIWKSNLPTETCTYEKLCAAMDREKEEAGKRAFAQPIIFLTTDDIANNTPIYQYALKLKEEMERRTAAKT